MLDDGWQGFVGVDGACWRWKGAWHALEGLFQRWSELVGMGGKIVYIIGIG